MTRREIFDCYWEVLGTLGFNKAPGLIFKQLNVVGQYKNNQILIDVTQFNNSIKGDVLGAKTILAHEIAHWLTGRGHDHQFFSCLARILIRIMGKADAKYFMLRHKEIYQLPPRYFYTTLPRSLQAEFEEPPPLPVGQFSKIELATWGILLLSPLLFLIYIIMKG